MKTTEKFYIIKDENNKLTWRPQSYFTGRLARQTWLNSLSDKKLFREHPLKDSLNNFCKEIKRTDENLEQVEKILIETIADRDGVFIKDEFEMKMQLFLSKLFNK